MKIKTQELKNHALNWAVAIANGWNDVQINDLNEVFFLLPKVIDGYEICGSGGLWQPVTDWNQGSMILGSEIDNFQKRIGYFYCNRHRKLTPHRTIEAAWATGPTLLVAANRCYVAAMLGAYVYVPDELIYSE